MKGVNETGAPFLEGEPVHVWPKDGTFHLETLTGVVLASGPIPRYLVDWALWIKGASEVRSWYDLKLSEDL